MYFFLRLANATGVSFPERDAREIAGALCIGIAAYGIAVGLLSSIWILLAAHGPALGFRSKVEIACSYLTSQFAKYLPGNVFQYVARHALGRRIGISHGTLAAAAVIEACLLACAAASLIVLFGMPVLHALFPDFPAFSRWWALLSLLAIPAIRFLPRRISVLGWIPPYSLPRLSLALCGYLVFFIVFGGLFWGILQWVSQTRYPPAPLIGGSSAAWLVGFAVPGAPAGAGLREAALTFATGASKPTGEVLAAIVFFRLVTLGGDLLAFIAGWLLSRTAKA